MGLPSSPSPKGSVRKRAKKAGRHEKHSSKDKPCPKRKTELLSGKEKDYMSLSSPIQGVSKAKSLYLMDILKSIKVL